MDELCGAESKPLFIPFFVYQCILQTESKIRHNINIQIVNITMT